LSQRKQRCSGKETYTVLKLKSMDLQKAKPDTLAVPVCEDRAIHTNRAIASLVKKAKNIPEFKGKKDDEVTFYHPDVVEAGRVMFLGLGKLEKLDAESLRSFTGKAVKKSISKDRSEIWIAVPSEKKIGLDISTILEAMMEGGCLGNHVFDVYKEKKKQYPLKEINFMVKSGVAKEYARLETRISSICQGTIMAREWVSTPSNEKRPEQFAASIIERAEKENLTVKMLDEKTLKRENFNTLLAVSAGSESKPGLVMLEYLPRKRGKTVVFVGKGVTFDSGGMNLKPSGSLEGMKADMAGAAAVAATIITASRLGSNINVVGVIPIVENMLSGKASRPGDVVKSHAGKTVEIGNTDAEGRLILIDAMSYAIKTYNPDTVIDIATLTGACVVALGEKVAGVFSTDDNLAGAIVASGKKTHERCWHMPLPDDYRELLKSEIADIRNISDGRGAGAITAALFLSEFVEKTRWAHVDIAGPAFLKKGSDYCGAGGTGFGVRLFCDLIENI
jgi:leucyl aminopeptidase